jgi:hypothetical protein
MQVNRRDLLYGMAVVFASFVRPGRLTRQETQSGLPINSARLQRRLEGLSVFARNQRPLLAHFSRAG